MLRLITMICLLFISIRANAQRDTKDAISIKPELDIADAREIKLPAQSPETAKNLMISSAARKSTFLYNVSEGRTNGNQKSGKRSTTIKSINQARRPQTDGRVALINIPVIPSPFFAKPNRIPVPNRRISLPVGRS